MQIEIKTTIPWKLHYSASGQLIAECEPLGLTLQADDEEEMRSLINEAQHVLFLDLLEDGELPAFLSRHGWTPSQPLPAKVGDDGVLFSAPFKLERQQHAPS